MRNVNAQRVQCDEIWSFVYAKDKNVKTAKAAPDGAGDVWTWTAIEADSKMILAYEVGDRSAQTAIEFMDDLCDRLTSRVQPTPQPSTRSGRIAPRRANRNQPS